MSRAIQKEVVIDAPPDVVWRALTDAEDLKRSLGRLEERGAPPRSSRLPSTHASSPVLADRSGFPGAAA